MNRSYRLVFNRALGIMQAAPETAQGRGKNGAARGLAAVCTAALAFASGPVSAAAWTANEGDWSEASNWRDGAVPNAATTVNIRNGGTAEIRDAAQALDLFLGLGTLPSQIGHLIVRNGGSLAIGDQTSIGSEHGSSALSVLTIDGGTVTGGNGNFRAWQNGRILLRNGGTLRTGTQGLALDGGTLEIGDTPGTLDSPYAWGTPDDNITGHLIFNHSAGDYTFAPVIQLDVAVAHTGTGTTTLTGGNTYTGGTALDAGVLRISNNANLGHASGILAFNGGTLQTTAAITMNRATALGAGGGTFDVASGDVIQQGVISGGGMLTKTGDGLLRLSGINTYAGGTVIAKGTLSIARSENLGTGPLSFGEGELIVLVPLVLHADIGGTSSTATISSSDTLTLEGNVTGFADLRLTGGPTGMVILNGADNAFTSLLVTGLGALQINGTVKAGTLHTSAGSALSGSGTVSNTYIYGGGILSPGQSSIGTLKVDGNLTLFDGSILDYQLGDPGTSSDPASGIGSRVDVTGNLTLNGALNLRSSSDTAQDGAPGLGYYRLMTYGGTLSGAGLSIGTTPGFSDPAHFEIQAGGGNVDLFIAALGHDTLQHWQGGDGAWNSANAQWLNRHGEVAVDWAGNHAVFMNQPGGFNGGTITVAGAQQFKGLQFRHDGYRLAGSGQLVIDGSERGDGNAEIRVLANSAEIATEITGSGGITKTDAGTLVLSGNNSYQGSTHILGGAVSIASDGNLGATGAGILLSGGTLATTADMATGRTITLAGNGGFDVAAGTTLAATGPIGGTGALVKTGAGTLRLAGANLYAGGTRVRQGVLIGDTASIRGNIANDGEVAFQQATDGVFAGDISGSGLMRKLGAGTLTLAGRNTQDWAVDAGPLRSAGSRFAGDVAIGANGVFVLDDAQAAAYAGTLSGTGRFHKQGAGSLLLTGDSAGFAGHATVSAGTLRVGDRHGGGILGGSLDVQAGATLGGSGTVGSGAGSQVTVASGGTLAPGNSVGTLTVNGDLVLAKGSRFEVEVDPQGSRSDQVAVTGNTTIQGGAVAHVGATGQYQLRSTYTLLTTGGALSGRFDTVSSDFAFLTPELRYDYGAGTVGLALARNDRGFASMALTDNQRATAQGIDSIGLAAGHAVYDAVAQLPDDAPLVRASLDALSGEIHASAKTALIEDSRFVRDAAKDRVRAAFAAPGASTAAVSARAADGAPTAVAATHDGPAAWSQAFGSWGSTDSDGNAARLERNVGGVLIGADRPMGNWRVGALAGYSHTDAKAADRASSGRSDNYHLGLYGGTQSGALGVRTGLAYSWHDIRTRRSVDIPGLSDSLRADYGGGTFQAFGELGYGIELNDTTRLEPYASLAYVRLHTDGYRESGGAAALTTGSANTETTFSTLGLRAEHALGSGAAQGTVRAAAGWRHAMGDTTPQARHAFSAGDAFTVAGVPIAQDSAVIELGVDLAVARNTRFGLSYAGQIAGSAQDHGVRADLSIRF
ncbi:outer membrane autotransporter barrel domain protein [Bordetella bronchiseptica SBL-F6116]|uniref:autotransporter domain-containing protein n=1 Tax=Bordetella bronchiseptica TaxID=518 RepID=UPI000459D6D7|nr:autotransporter domain-containing protein [Bordetella bronchiseptica]KCV25821.1 putative extracellular serine protease [Bordetella bronchiseptica 00-P-2730]KDE01592.1 outer membrane autotransporter barrel domain protein [Bordetella bronchiseptica SBL-F6116]